MSAARLESVPSLDSARADWARLAAASGNVFSTSEWAGCWWHHFGRNGSLQLKIWRGPEGQAVALFPLYTTSLGPLRVVRFVGSPLGSRIGPICAPGDAADAARGLRVAAAAVHADLLFADALPAEEEWPRLLGVPAWKSIPSPVIDLSRFRTWEEYLRTRSANLRQELGRKERKLQRERGLSFRLATDRDRLPADLACFFSLHSDRWGERSSLGDGSGLAFLRDFCVLAFDRGWLRLWFLDLDGEAAAAWLGFRFEGIETYYQAGRLPAAGDASTGTILLAHSIREALADGIGEYRLGPGGSTYKYRFTDTDPGIQAIAGANTRRGRFVLRAYRTAQRSTLLRRLGRRVVYG